MAELDRDRIAAAALATIDEHGVDGFTMRAVAQALGVTPMALYHHVADKAGLVALVVQAALSERPLPPATAEWQEDLWQSAKWVRDGAHLHPAVSLLHVQYNSWVPETLPILERWAGIWQQSGLPLRHAIEASTVSSLAVYGYVLNEVRWRASPRPSEQDLTWFPMTRQFFSADHDVDAEFETMVRSLIEGLFARLSQTPVSPVAQSARA